MIFHIREYFTRNNYYCKKIEPIFIKKYYDLENKMLIKFFFDTLIVIKLLKNNPKKVNYSIKFIKKILEKKCYL